MKYPGIPLEPVNGFVVTCWLLLWNGVDKEAQILSAKAIYRTWVPRSSIFPGASMVEGITDVWVLARDHTFEGMIEGWSSLSPTLRRPDKDKRIFFTRREAIAEARRRYSAEIAKVRERLELLVWLRGSIEMERKDHKRR